jgi:hypothetical protein
VPQLQFLSQKSYLSVPVAGASLLWAIDPDRPVGYTPPAMTGLTMAASKTVWRATRRDTAQLIDQAVAVDLGSFQLLSDAMYTCGVDADLQGVADELVFQATTSYQSLPVSNWPWLYNISQPSGDPNGPAYWRSLRRDGSQTDEFQTAITIGNYDQLVDAMTACQNDLNSNNPPEAHP